MMNGVQDLVSVIIACYNGAEYLDQCMNSLVNQTYQNIEIIICDDCSTDSSKKKIEQWMNKDERIKAIFLERNCFAAAARNKCIKHAAGKYIVIQDVDDASAPDRIEKLVQAISSRNDLSIISSSMKVFYDHINDSDEVMHRKNARPTRWTFLTGIPFNHPASLFTTECLRTVNGYQEGDDTRRIEDYDLFARLYAAGYKGINLDEPLYYYRQDINCIARRTLLSRIRGLKVMHNDFKMLKVYPLAIPFLIKPILGYFRQYFKYPKRRYIRKCQ